ncbi:MAG TPA: toxin-antitoxin system HicB family antitoxin [Myxococcota bacterium]|nr:toxin-antitoxin system HicB family antitoxin [Myxococcota bacterium]
MAERKPFLLRLPPDLHDELRAWADQELRSLNAHIEYLLRDAVQRRRRARRDGERDPPD